MVKRSARTYAMSLGAKLSMSEDRAADVAPTKRILCLVPGTGFEPVFLGSEASVLPARRSRNEKSADDEDDVGSRAINGWLLVRCRMQFVGPEGVEPSQVRLRGGYAAGYVTDLQRSEGRERSNPIVRVSCRDRANEHDASDEDEGEERESEHDEWGLPWLSGWLSRGESSRW